MKKLFLLLATACTVFTFKSLPIYAANSGSQIKGPGAALAALTQLVGGVAPVYAYTNALDAADNSFNSL